MMAKLANQSFVKRNLVAIVMVPSILGIHWGWSILQQNKTLVSEKEQMDLPVVLFAKYCYRRLTGGDKNNALETAPNKTAD